MQNVDSDARQHMQIILVEVESNQPKMGANCNNKKVQTANYAYHYSRKKGYRNKKLWYECQ